MFFVCILNSYLYIELDLDLSGNDLPAVPDVVYKLKALRRLNLNDNLITELTGQSG
jgi:Leucine-rich repeat (LRR) protein